MTARYDFKGVMPAASMALTFVHAAVKSRPVQLSRGALGLFRERPTPLSRDLAQLILVVFGRLLPPPASSGPSTPESDFCGPPQAPFE